MLKIISSFFNILLVYYCSILLREDTSHGKQLKLIFVCWTFKIVKEYYNIKSLNNWGGFQPVEYIYLNISLFFNLFWKKEETL